MPRKTDKVLLPKYFCEYCNYECKRSDNYEKHLLTSKHYSHIQNIQSSKPFACNKCNKSYKERSGLWRHSKTCKEINDEMTDDEPTLSINSDTTPSSELGDKEIIKTLLQQNAGLQNLVLDVVKTGTNSHNHNHTNSHNKTFNLNFFLNDTCKDAMNMTEFVNNLKLQLSDLENVGETGYVSGISNIIVKNLKDMDVTERPIHCTDVKRDTLYIKDDDQWDKDDNDNGKVKKAIRRVAQKNSKLLSEFKEKNPEYNKSSSRVSDKYNKLLIETMGGKGDNDVLKEKKIIKNISKEIIIDKGET